MSTTKQLAGIAYRSLETATRPDGSTYVRRTETAPEWVKELCFAAHGDMSPDDIRYEMIRTVLANLEDCDDPDEYQQEPDVYTNELTAWLASRADRVAYCDDASEESGREDTMFERLAGGQAMEYREITKAIVSFLTEQVESNDAEADAEANTEADAEGQVR